MTNRLLKATEVFVPGSYPEHSYVDRADPKIEQTLRDGVDTPGIFISVAGPSKSGKTVLIEKVIGKDNLIQVTGSGIESADEIWERVLDCLEIPIEKSFNESLSRSQAVEVSANGKVGFPLVANAGAGAKGSVKREENNAKSEKYKRRGLAQVVEELANSQQAILIDDFHYIPTPLQIEVMRQVKEAARGNIKIFIASVLHRADEAIRANTEVQGRFVSIDLEYWKPSELKKIGIKGFEKLNAKIPDALLDKLCIEAAGSPQLMQTLCLQTCRRINHREQTSSPKSYDPTSSDVQAILEDSSSSMDYRTLVDVLDCGPKERGRERKIYAFKDNTSGDVYRCILKSLALDPPSLSFDYDELSKRAASICTSDTPSGSSIQGSCEHMIKLARTKFPDEKAIDWNKEREILDIAEPYLLFYFRWSGRLKEPNE